MVDITALRLQQYTQEIDYLIGKLEIIHGVPLDKNAVLREATKRQMMSTHLNAIGVLTLWVNLGLSGHPTHWLTEDMMYKPKTPQPSVKPAEEPKKRVVRVRPRSVSDGEDDILRLHNIIHRLEQEVERLEHCLEASEVRNGRVIQIQLAMSSDFSNKVSARMDTLDKKDRLNTFIGITTSGDAREAVGSLLLDHADMLPWIEVIDNNGVRKWRR